MRDKGAPAALLRGTSGRVAGLIRRAPMTVEELATELALTENAIRAHIARLVRAGFVRRSAWRRSATKPAAQYALTPQGELLFSRAYAPVLTELLHALARRTAPVTFRAILHEVGRRLFPHVPEDAPRTGAELEARVRAASARLNALGAVTAVEHASGYWRIRGFGCPLDLATRQYPEGCIAVAAIVSEFVGVPVRSCCERGERPRCCFDVRPSGRHRESSTNSAANS